ncbi:MAG: PadR family transcriptional regulator [Acidobacteriota bacterium]
MQNNLTTTSYLVLGLVARLGAATPYDLKRAVYHTVEYFWAFPHSQLYAEPDRLKKAGYLKESRERSGRRRRTFTITESGRAALANWLREPTEEPIEIRDLALLKLYFGELATAADVQTLAAQQLNLHQARLAEYEALRQTRQLDEAGARFPLAVLDMGMLFERAALAFWQTIINDPPGAGKRLQPASEFTKVAKNRASQLPSAKARNRVPIGEADKSVEAQPHKAQIFGEPEVESFVEDFEKATTEKFAEETNSSLEETLPDHLL